MSNAAVQDGLHAITMAQDALLQFIADIPADKLTWAPVPGGNHALWVVGHLVWTNGLILAALGGPGGLVPDDYTARCGAGSQPTPDAAAYPSLDELTALLRKTDETLGTWYRALSDEQLVAPVPENLRGFAPTRTGLLGALAWHMGLHAGQVTVIRKALGLKPKFM